MVLYCEDAFAFFSAFSSLEFIRVLLSAGRGTRSQTCIKGIDVEFNDAKIRETLEMKTTF